MANEVVDGKERMHKVRIGRNSFVECTGQQVHIGQRNVIKEKVITGEKGPSKIQG